MLGRGGCACTFALAHVSVHVFVRTHALEIRHQPRDSTYLDFFLFEIEPGWPLTHRMGLGDWARSPRDLPVSTSQNLAVPLTKNCYITPSSLSGDETQALTLR